MTDGIRADLAHPHYCRQNNCEGGGAHMEKTGGCEGNFVMMEGCTNAELQQQLKKAYICEKGDERMM
jgi:hypothetical protein